MSITTAKILLIVFSVLIYLFRLNYPANFVFDEVYHAFTAKEYLKGDVQAWEWWSTPPPNVAYEWTHPPLAKEIMAASMILLRSENSWAWRFPGALLGVISAYLIYRIGKLLFNEKVGLISSFLFTLSGLPLVQARVGMNDIYLITFCLSSFFFLLKKKLLIGAIFWGLALSCKWTAIYFLPLIFLLTEKRVVNILIFLILGPMIYFISYFPFFLAHSLDQFIELQKQMWWYHTNLKATHDYSSPWWSWPLNLVPVWYHVEYLGGRVANIFAAGNFLIFWAGIAAIILSILEIVRSTVINFSPKSIIDKIIKHKNLLILLSGYLIFWLPWAISPRIMFLYHYTPSIPFLSLILGYQLSKLTDRSYLILFLFLAFLVFILTYPFLTGIPIPERYIHFFFLFNSAKNPFSF